MFFSPLFKNFTFMKKTSFAPSVLIILFGLSTAFLSLYFMLEREKNDIKSQVFSRTHELKNSIEREYYKAESVLRGIEGFILSSQDVTRKEFETFCRSTIDKEAPFHIVEWQPKVPAHQREAYESRAVSDGLKNFKFFEIDGKGRPIPAKKRLFHFPVYYSYSPMPEFQTVGLDLAFSPLRMKSKYRSMKLGQAVVSGTFPLLTKGQMEGHRVFAITYPVFNSPAISQTDDLKDLKGFIAIVVYIKEFFAPLTKIERKEFFEFVVIDRDDDDDDIKNKAIFSTLKNKQVAADLSQTISIDVNNRNLELVVYPTKKLVKSETTYLPWIIWLLIMAISLGLAVYVFIKSKNQEKVNLYERQLQQKQRLESIGVLASGIAHEFNNILHCITLSTEGLSFSDDKDSHKERVETTLDYCIRGRELVRQILSFARKDSGAFEEVLLAEELRKTMELIRSSNRHQIEFELDIQEEKHVPAYINVSHISQIMINLCNNSAHAMNNQGVIKISYQLTDSEHIISVQDHGHGMSEDVMEKLFDPFFTTKAINEGTGLGLSVIFGIVKSYSGDIEVASEVGKGSIFKVKLPR
jgi:signal transduction histidine kinase